MSDKYNVYTTESALQGDKPPFTEEERKKGLIDYVKVDGKWVGKYQSDEPDFDGTVKYQEEPEL